MSDIELAIRSPWRGEPLDILPLMTWKELDALLERAALLARRPEEALPTDERIRILEGCLEQVVRRREEFALTAAREGGKPLADSNVELDRAAEGIRMAIAVLKTHEGRVLPMGFNAASRGRLAYTQREPLGPVLAISAFNHPFNLIVHQAITAVAAGCPVLVKPALVTPLSCRNLLQCLYDAGLPGEWCSMIFCEDELTARLAADPRLAFVSFIGSAEVGWKLRSRLAPGAACVLEHGGAAPVLLAEDADLEAAIAPLVKGAMYHAGQVCVSVQRVFAPKAQAKDVAGRLAEAAKGLRVGDPALAGTEVGPLIRRSAHERVSAWVEEARAGGAAVLCGGSSIDEDCYAPTVLLDPPADSAVMRKEIFGPVVCVTSFDSLEEAVGRANELPLAFQAAAFTQSLDTALFLQRRLRANAVMINDHTAFRVDWMPFGGSEHAGLGMGGIAEAMRDMSREKLVVWKSPSIP